MQWGFWVPGKGISAYTYLGPLNGAGRYLAEQSA